VAVARDLLEQARAVEAERARVAAEEAAAVEAAEWLRSEQDLAALTLRVQQMQTQLGSSVVPPAAADAEETQCVVCMDAPKNRVVLPCMHMCVCEACAQLLRDRAAQCVAGPSSASRSCSPRSALGIE
jgi:uncharacterized ferredoxin-like protein